MMKKTIKDLIHEIFYELKIEIKSIKSSKNILFADISGFLVIISAIIVLPLTVAILWLLYQKADRALRKQIHEKAESDAPFWANYYEFNPWKASITYYYVLGRYSGRHGGHLNFVYCMGDHGHLTPAPYYGVLKKLKSFEDGNIAALG